MKKIAIVLTIGALLFSGAMFHSCNKDEMRNENASFENRQMKDETTCALPLFMDQTHYIGCVDIYVDPDGVYLFVNLDGDLDGYAVTESHLFYGAAAPTMWQPGQFPYYLDLATMSWSLPEAFECGVEYLRYFALHLQLEKEVVMDDGSIVIMEESAWLLTDGGMPLRNNKGKIVGWGEYFSLNLMYLPEITSLDLLITMTPDIPESWMTVEGFTMCLDPLVNYYYFDAELETNTPIMENFLNEFYADPEMWDNPVFYDYWMTKFVGVVDQPWEMLMYQILTGEEPMFYLKRVGEDYMLIDGLQYLLFLAGAPGYTGDEILRINGNYPPGIYEYTGFLTGDNCVGEPFTITMTIACD